MNFAKYKVEQCLSVCLSMFVCQVKESLTLFYQVCQYFIKQSRMTKKYKNEDKFYIFFNLFHLNQSLNLQLNVNKIAAASLASRGSLFQVV